MRSAVYSGFVRHRRFGAPPNEFRYSLYMMYLDLEELPELFDGRWLWSARRPSLAWFRRGDYLGKAAEPLDGAVRREVERLTGRRPRGPIRLLTHLRYLGFVMNPVSFYYCFDEAGTGVDAVLAEITNTPWNERHTYAVSGEGRKGATGRPHRFEKEFHVSPFMSMAHEYAWTFSDPGAELLVHMENTVEGELVFDATLSLSRTEISGRSLAAALCRYPVMTARVAGGIYWQAVRLWMKGATFHPHPRSSAA
jgi:DUF1365 family protein